MAGRAGSAAGGSGEQTTCAAPFPVVPWPRARTPRGRHAPSPWWRPPGSLGTVARAGGGGGRRGAAVAAARRQGLPGSDPHRRRKSRRRVEVLALRLRLGRTRRPRRGKHDRRRRRALRARVDGPLLGWHARRAARGRPGPFRPAAGGAGSAGGAVRGKGGLVSPPVRAARRRAQLGLQDGELRLHLSVSGRHLQRPLILLDGPLQVAERLPGLRQEAARQDVVGRLPKRALELHVAAGGVARLEERPAQRETRRRVAGMHGQAGARHANRLGELAVLAQLLGQLGEEPGPRIALQAAAEFVDAGVSHDQNGSGPAPRPAPPRAPTPALGYHCWKICTVCRNPLEAFPRP